jgi:hypothetical protein
MIPSPPIKNRHMLRMKYSIKAFLYPMKRVRMIKGINRKSKINPLAKLMGNAIQRIIETDVREIIMGLL